MNYTSAVGFRQALDDRLKAEAKNTGLGLSRLRKRVAFELFLRRLVAVAPDRWVLKGALALDFRLNTTTRSTRDIDIGRADTEEAAIDDLAAAQQLVMDDFFAYAVTRTDPLVDTGDSSTIRFNVNADLAGRTFESFVLDISFVDALPMRPETVRTTAFLSFAGIEQVLVPAIPIHEHIAEKVHAYTRSYGPSQRRSSRPKDLVDILLIESSETIYAVKLREALQRTFATRNTHALPSNLPPPPPNWAAPYARLANEVGIEPDLTPAQARAAAFLDPVLAIGARGRWDPRTARWTEPPNP